jgi:CrcB protein
MTKWAIWAAVASGGALGAMLRHAVNGAALRLLGPNFPWGTAFVNVAGSLAMGLFIAWLVGREPHPAALRAFVAVGFLGAFTTFSSFSLDVITLFREKAFVGAALYLAGSVIFSVGGLIAGLVAGRALW